MQSNKWDGRVQAYWAPGQEQSEVPRKSAAVGQLDSLMLIILRTSIAQTLTSRGTEQWKQIQHPVRTNWLETSNTATPELTGWLLPLVTRISYRKLGSWLETLSWSEAPQKEKGGWVQLLPVAACNHVWCCKRRKAASAPPLGFHTKSPKGSAAVWSYPRHHCGAEAPRTQDKTWRLQAETNLNTGDTGGGVERENRITKKRNLPFKKACKLKCRTQEDYWC